MQALRIPCAWEATLLVSLSTSQLACSLCWPYLAHLRSQTIQPSLHSLMPPVTHTCCLVLAGGHNDFNHAMRDWYDEVRGFLGVVVASV
jgi:hypothetical protein